MAISKTNEKTGNYLCEGLARVQVKKGIEHSNHLKKCRDFFIWPILKLREKIETIHVKMCKCKRCNIF